MCNGKLCVNNEGASSIPMELALFMCRMLDAGGLVQYLAQELLRACFVRVVIDFIRRVLFDDTAIVDEDDAVGGGTRKAHLVRYHDHGHLEPRPALSSHPAPRRSSLDRGQRWVRRRASSWASWPRHVQWRCAAAGRLKAGWGNCRFYRPAPHVAAAGWHQLWRFRVALLSTLSGASMTFSKAVKWGNKLKRWNTMPIPAR